MKFTTVALYAPLVALSAAVPLDSVPLSKRYDGRITFYTPGLGACGQTNSASDFVAALASPAFDNPSHCGQSVVVTVGGKSVTVTVVDKCPGCVSHGHYSYFSTVQLELIGY